MTTPRFETELKTFSAGTIIYHSVASYDVKKIGTETRCFSTTGGCIFDHHDIELKLEMVYEEECEYAACDMYDGNDDWDELRSYNAYRVIAATAITDAGEEFLLENPIVGTILGE